MGEDDLYKHVGHMSRIIGLRFADINHHGNDTADGIR